VSVASKTSTAATSCVPAGEAELVPIATGVAGVVGDETMAVGGGDEVPVAGVEDVVQPIKAVATTRTPT
jgi:hypothetical protein